MTPQNIIILNILRGSKSLYHKRLRRYSQFKGQKEGHGHFQQFRTGFTTSHSSQVIPWHRITLNFTVMNCTLKLDCVESSYFGAPFLTLLLCSRLFLVDTCWLILTSAHISGIVITIFMSPSLTGTRNHQISRASLPSKMFPFFNFYQKSSVTFTDLAKCQCTQVHPSSSQCAHSYPPYSTTW